MRKCNSYSQEIISVWQIEKIVFKSFRFREMSLEDESRPGSLLNFDVEVLKSLTESNHLQCTLELANMLNTYLRSKLRNDRESK